MKLTFSIDYRTNWGEQVYIIGNIPEMGADQADKAVEMRPDVHGHIHTATIEISPAHAGISYRYEIRRGSDIVRREWGASRTLHLDSRLTSALIYDRWQDQPWNKPYYSSAFTDCICKPAGNEAAVVTEPDMVQLVVDAPMVPPHLTLAVSGSCEALGQWDPARAVVMNSSQFPRWTVQLPLEGFDSRTEYKFLLLDKATHQPAGWEKTDNRTLYLPEASEASSVIVAGLFFESPLPLWRGAGVAIPVFSLRTEKDFGVGDFYDLIPMIDWAASTGQRFIQLLPINDTTMTHSWTDSYPYNANSCFALHPMYLRLQEMGQLADRKRQSHYDALAKQLNELGEVDYEQVNRAKNEFTRELFNQQGEAEMTSPEFKAFVKRNEEWLMPYAAFCVLRDRYRTADMACWEEYAVYSPDKIKNFIKQNPVDINYVLYLQYHLDKQLRFVRNYAHSKGVAIKGDIPIGISRNSVDAWTSPELFNMNCSAGAPPDDFSVLGQNWGFPTYNWAAMSRDGYAWWKARFRKMAEYFDAYRIDHVLGFFRIWQIPLDALHGLLGVFNPALPLSPDEMRYNYDFHIDVDANTRPYITDNMLGDFFGDLADEVRSAYLVNLGYGHYALKPEFSTQRAVANHFAANPMGEKSERLCNGLLGLIDDVLFIEDPYEKGKYHPRIAAQYTYAYRALSDHQRWCFDRLYNDFFYHRHNDFWRDKAMEKLPPLIDATQMLVCAEDLGMIPACVPDVMHRLEILSLEIQRMPKDPSVKFANTWTYPYLSVCTTSTHDMGGIRQWWEEDHDATQRYYNEVLGHQGAAPFYAEPWICRQIVDNHLKSPSMLCILPLQDMLATDGELRRHDPRQEQINIPANPRHYWRYRMHLTIEQLQQAEAFNHGLTDMIANSGR